jgi:stringent starvation protein B
MDTKRLQEIVTALMARRLEDSLVEVERALAAWRDGKSDVLEAHAETMRHAARAGALSARVARAGLEGADALLRDALEAGLVTPDEFRELTGKDAAQVSPPPPLGDEAGSPRMPAKRTVMDKLLADGPVLVHLDPRKDGVRIPDSFAGQPQLVLRFGFGLSPPIHDLTIDDEAVHGTLTFRGTPFGCVIPWTAIFALVAEDGRGLVWPEDVPAEVAKEYLDKGLGPRDQEPEPPKPKKGGHLKLV